MANFKLRIRGQFSASLNWSCGFNCTASELTSTVSSTLASSWTTFWNTATNGYANLCTSAVTVFSADAYQMSSTWQMMSKVSTTLSLVGTASGDSMPFNTTPVIHLFNPAQPSSEQGWIKLPAAAESQAAGDVYSSAFLTSLATVLAVFWSNMSALTAFQPVTYNRRTNKQGDPPFTLHTLTNNELTSKVYTLRQRTRKQPIVRSHSAAI